MKISKKFERKAAVYDRWLSTLGGGEQVAFAYAQTLRDIGYETSILTHQEIDIQKAEKKMDVNLRNISLVYLPIMSSNQLSQYTEKYDVFINTSYLDYFPNRSSCGILSIFFPSQIFLTPYEYIKRAIVLPSFSHFFIYPSSYQGFLYDEYKLGKIYKWMGPESSILFNKGVSSFSITLFCRALGISLVDSIQFFIETKRVFPSKIRINDHTNTVSFTFQLKHANKGTFVMRLPNSPLSENVALVKLTIYSFRYLLYNAFKKYFPKWEMRLHGGPGVTKLSDLTSYNKIVTISEFSKKWIKKYWGLESCVLYPPVATKDFRKKKEKKNWISHVGRFFVTGHNKKQLELVKVFRKMIDEGVLKGWELHFIGSINPGKTHHDYFEQVKYYAKGYPVVFHLDATFTDLRDVLATSKIYWHATGLDENENTDPILFEHFGITTVEAMASGCVPVVIDAGGQKEIVITGSGYTFSKRDELMAHTKTLAQNPRLLKKVSQSAILRSQYFDRKEFKKRFTKIVRDF